MSVRIDGSSRCALRPVWLAVLLAGGLLAGRAEAGGGAETTAVVVNADSWASLTVANEFIHLRGIPPRNVVYLHGVPDIDQVTVEVFRERVLKPVLEALRQRGLDGQIDCLAYSSDLPSNIDLREELKTGDLSAVPEPIRKVFTPEASINGLTYLHEMVLAKDLHYLDMRSNWYCRQPVRRGDELSVQRAIGFRAGARYAPDGAVAAQGRRYLLSTMLAVTSGRGNSVGEALACLRRSASADGTRPPGRIYFMKNQDVRSRIREGLFAAAVEELRGLGIGAEIAEGLLPAGKKDVAGLMTGTEGFNWRSSGSQIAPGAICDHFTSWGGVMREDGRQTPVSEFIRHGAAGACGTVTEPYAIGAKFPTAFLQVHYARGCCLAEAFYLSVAGPYQLLIVGDPLCQPWARIPEVGVSMASGDRQVGPGDTVKGTVKIQPAGKPDADVGRFELFVDGTRKGSCAAGEAIELDTTALPDGYHELTVVGVARGEVMTRGRKTVPLHVDNRGLKLAVTPPEVKELTWDQPAVFRAALDGARRIRFLHNGREVGAIEGAAGTVRLDLRSLGQGRVRIVPEGVLAGKDGPDATVVGEPVGLEVRPPIPTMPPDAPAGQKPAKGVLVVTAAGRKVVPAKYSYYWMRDAGLKEGDGFEVHACLTVPDHDVYQFQLRTDADVRMELNGRPLDLPKTEPWRFIPVSLAAGTHELVVRGKLGARPRLELRFGGQGTYNVVNTLQHRPVPGEEQLGEPAPK